MAARPEGLEWDYVIVGSGAGGGTLAARLVEAGMRVFLLEAGGDPRDSDAARMPDDYDVPGLPRLRLREPGDELELPGPPLRRRGSARRATRSTAPARGVLYPRAAALGGCTAHNAMIFMLPHESDWDHIAQLTGDALVACRAHAPLCQAARGLPPPAALARAAPTRHRSDRARLGRLAAHREVDAARGLRRRRARGRWSSARRAALSSGLPTPLASVLRWLRGGGDPNARPWGRRQLRRPLLHAVVHRDHRRVGTRERLLEVGRGASATGCTSSSTRWPPASSSTSDGAARGVEYLQGQAPLPGARARQRRRRRSARSARAARGDPLRRRLQHAAAADAVRHRSGGASARARHSGRASTCRASGAICRTATRSRVTHRMRRPWRVARRRALRARRSALAALERRAEPACTPRTARRWR